MIIKDLINNSSDEFTSIIENYNKVYVTKSIEVMLANITTLDSFINEIEELKTINLIENKILNLAKEMTCSKPKVGNDTNSEDAIRREEFNYNGDSFTTDGYALETDDGRRY
ncbi:MAG: hypothetical protein KAJ49_01605 [Arcobacteraceae bacterium]|nr:hypothetical protein [Arcobacteraceae bacterium]